MKPSSPRTWREATPDGSVARFSRSSRPRRSRRARRRPLADLDVIYVSLDAVALRVRSAGKVVSAPVLGVVAVLSDGRKDLLAVELCGGESFAAWKGCLDD